MEFVNGSSNDWDRLLDLGVLWQAERVMLSASSSLLVDLSAAGNALVAVSELGQSFPGESIHLWTVVLALTWSKSCCLACIHALMTTFLCI